jgi:hypothetical protein
VRSEAAVAVTMKSTFSSSYSVIRDESKNQHKHYFLKDFFTAMQRFDAG